MKNNTNKRSCFLWWAVSYNQYFWQTTDSAWSYHKCIILHIGYKCVMWSDKKQIWSWSYYIWGGPFSHENFSCPKFAPPKFDTKKKEKKNIIAVQWSKLMTFEDLSPMKCHILMMLLLLPKSDLATLDSMWTIGHILHDIGWWQISLS